jgi:hypothetical protein
LENQLAQAKNKSIEEDTSANEKDIRNDGSDNDGGYFNRNFHYSEICHSRGEGQGWPFHCL